VNEATRNLMVVALLVASATIFLQYLWLFWGSSGWVALVYLLVGLLFLFGVIAVLKQPVERPLVFWKYNKPK